MRGAPPAPGEALGVDEYREIAYAITESGTLQFTLLRGTGSYPVVAVPGLNGGRVTAVAQSGAGHHALGTSDGRVVPLDVRFKVEFKDGRRMLTPEHEFGTPRRARPREEATDRGARERGDRLGPRRRRAAGPR